MRILCVGGGPAGLYAALLLKKSLPDAEVRVVERNAEDQTFGWGVVFSDETLTALAEADAPSFAAISAAFARWEDIDVHFKGKVVRSSGHGFVGIARRRLLALLQARAREVGVDLVFSTDLDDIQTADWDLVIACDGVTSRLRAKYADTFRPTLEKRSSRYIWLGTPHLFEAFTFLFEQNRHGFFQVHGYRFDETTSTFIAECDEASFRAADLERATTDETIAYLQGVFGKAIDHAPLLANRASWIQFLNVKNARWRHENVVLLGDAAHTAHFSIGSGTKLAMEDAIALARAVVDEVAGVAGNQAPPAARIEQALSTYEEQRRPIVERTQRVAEHSLGWFENARRYFVLDPLPFAVSLLTRSKQIGFDNLEVRDAAFVEAVQAQFVKRAYEAVGEIPRAVRPMFAPLKLRDLRLDNRVVVSPMCMYVAKDGCPNDFHLVHLGSRATGGAGLVFTEMTNVSANGRITPGCTGIYEDAHVEAWRRIVQYVHRHSRAKIALQLGHAGRKGATCEPWLGEDRSLDAEAAWELLAPSAIPYKPSNATPRAMTRVDMDAVRQSYEHATDRAEQAGFDLLEVHMAHGYLLGTFLSPLTNVRTDEYGGSVENRLRFPLEIFDAVRARWPAHKPMSVRISATDWADGGNTGDDAVAVARALQEHGVDLIDVSSGQTVPQQAPIYGRMFQTTFADRIRQEVGIRTMTVGNITSADQVNTILTAERADLCALARPHLRDPYWTLHAAAAAEHEEALWPRSYAVVDPARRGLSDGEMQRLARGAVGLEHRRVLTGRERHREPDRRGRGRDDGTVDPELGSLHPARPRDAELDPLHREVLLWVEDESAIRKRIVDAKRGGVANAVVRGVRGAADGGGGRSQRALGAQRPLAVERRVVLEDAELGLVQRAAATGPVARRSFDADLLVVPADGEGGCVAAGHPFVHPVRADAVRTFAGQRADGDFDERMRIGRVGGRAHALTELQRVFRTARGAVAHRGLHHRVKDRAGARDAADRGHRGAVEIADPDRDGDRAGEADGPVVAVALRGARLRRDVERETEGFAVTESRLPRS
jgi:anthraniloyl-CoA monooxygenase